MSPLSFPRTLAAVWAAACLCLTIPTAHAQDPPAPVSLTTGWQLQDAAKVTQTGVVLSQPNYKPSRWYKATVPGTSADTKKPPQSRAPREASVESDAQISVKRASTRKASPFKPVALNV